MPIMRPCLILVGVLNMITVWNDYLGPLIFLQDRSKYTLALGLASFKGVHQTQIIPMLCITVVMIIRPWLRSFPARSTSSKVPQVPSSNTVGGPRVAEPHCSVTPVVA